LSPRLAADRYLPQEYEYADETLADRTQRERRRELAREQAGQYSLVFTVADVIGY